MANELIFYGQGKKDDLGRSQYWVKWWSDQIGKKRNESGFAGQCRFGNMEEEINRLTQLGRKVIIENQVNIN